MTMSHEQSPDADLVIPNAALAQMRRGEPLLVLSVRLVHTVDIVPIALAAGFDTIYVDMEHCGISVLDTGQICVTALQAGVTPFVRVPSAAPELIGQILDGGAMGVIVPQLRTVEEVREVVSASRFPPLGSRSVSSASPQLRYRSPGVAEANRLLNEVTIVAPMVETVEALAAVDEFAAVPGVDMVFVGANDLTTALGVPGEYGHPRMREAYSSIIAAAKRHGRLVAVAGVAGDPALLKELIAEGVDFISVGTDLGLLMAGARAALKRLTDHAD